MPRANTIWKKMVAEYEQPPIDPAIDDALKDYMTRRKRELAGKSHQISHELTLQPFNFMRASHTGV